MSTRDGMEVVAPRSFIVPNITKSNQSSALLSGQLVISGGCLMVSQFNKWCYISGASVKRPLGA